MTFKFSIPMLKDHSVYFCRQIQHSHAQTIRSMSKAFSFKKVVHFYGQFSKTLQRLFSTYFTVRIRAQSLPVSGAHLQSKSVSVSRRVLPCNRIHSSCFSCYKFTFLRQISSPLTVEYSPQQMLLKWIQSLSVKG